MTSLELDERQAEATPLPGRILLQLDKPLEMIGSIVIPETARDQSPDRTQLVSATVIRVGSGPYLEHDGNGKLKRYPGLAPEDVKPGDRVLYNPLMKDLNRKYLLTAVSRVEAVIG